MNEKALILSCGGSPEPLIFCIEEYEPNFIYFLCSSTSSDIADSIVNKLNINGDQYNLKIVKNHESLDESFAKSREIIKELQKEYTNIHIDFTGGTKPMVSGLVLAAIGEKCTYTYVGSMDDNSRDKQGMGIVKSGFEKIKEQKDPYDVYAVMEFEKGMEFFDNYQFQASKTNFIEASEKLESKDLREIAKFFVDLVKLYELWDKFNNLLTKKRTLKVAFNDILDRIEDSSTLKSYFEEDYPKFKEQIKYNSVFLDLKLSRRGMIEFNNVKYYLPDLLNNALRRIEEGKYDDAVARLYRAIELIAQIELVNNNLINDQILRVNKEFKINKNSIIALNNPNIESLICNWNEYRVNPFKKTFGIPSNKSYKLLCALNVSFAEDYLNDKKLKNNVNSRNGSILAHGLNPINEKKAKELFNQVVTYSKEVFTDVDNYMEMSKFPKFSAD